MQVRLSAEQLLRVILAEVDDVVIDLLRKRLDPGPASAAIFNGATGRESLKT